MSIIALGFAYVFFAWSCVVVVVQAIGISRLFRSYSRPRPAPVAPTLRDDEVPHLTILRPIKGLETNLHECLVSTLRQAYPLNKLSVYFCVDSPSDPALPTLRKLLAEFPKIDARIYIEAEDPFLHGPHGHAKNLGPNPKIRNLSRAYREAKGDIVWVVDANIWVGPNVGGRMVDKLCGYLPGGARSTPYKFVHQLPLVVDIASSPRLEPYYHQEESPLSTVKKTGGGRLEEMFMATSHAKFYGAINSVGIAPCVVGKSNMWRRSHLQQLTSPDQNPTIVPCPSGLLGIDYFSRYICEDHMIGDLLFKCRIPGFKNHGLVEGDIAIQPASSMGVEAYIARRVRWLRARKWTVLLATLVEPGVESFLCNFYLSFALTTIPQLSHWLRISPNWSSMGLLWLMGVIFWMLVDRVVFGWLHRGQSTEVDSDTPFFAQGTRRPCGVPQRSLGEWLAAWIGREVLALPIWTWAVLLGATVNWRGNNYKVHSDMSVEEIQPSNNSRAESIQTPNSENHDPRSIRRTTTPEVEGGLRGRSKDRVE